MRSDPFELLHYIPDDQRAIDEQLANWGASLRQGSRTGSTSPMWRMAARGVRAAAYGSLTISRVRHDDAEDIECSLPMLPRMHADALRWYYWRGGSPFAAAKELGCAKWDLVSILTDARRRLIPLFQARQDARVKMRRVRVLHAQGVASGVFAAQPVASMAPCPHPSNVGVPEAA